MRKSVFITGATGFIGKVLVRRLVAKGAYKITALVRHVPERNSNDLNWVVGDLLDSKTYHSSLRNVGAVIHLAATTGKASPYEHELTNVEGTRRLLEAAKAAGVQRFVYISTIAVTFPDQRWYPYAQTKKSGGKLGAGKRHSKHYLATHNRTGCGLTDLALAQPLREPTHYPRARRWTSSGSAHFCYRSGVWH